MNWSKLFIFGAFVLFVFSCSSENSSIVKSNEESQNGILPSSDIFYEVPTSMASPTCSEAVVAAKMLSDSSDSSDKPINFYDVYKPIPIYINMANEAKKSLKNFIDTLNTYNFKGNGEFDVNGRHVVVREKSDTLAFGKNLKYFDIKITQNEKPVLFMNYFKNSNGHYRGRFMFHDINGIDSGLVVLIRYNGWDSGVDGKRMDVRFYKPRTLFGQHNDDDPVAIKINFCKKGDVVLASGISYHPTFTDDFFGNGEMAYSFKVVGNVVNNSAILEASFLPIDSLDGFSFNKKNQKYKLDNFVKERATEIFKDSLKANRTLSNVVFYSLEKNEPISMNDTLQLLKIFTYRPKMNVEEFNSDNFVKFIELNKNWVLKDDSFRSFYSFVSVKQPIFLEANALIVGSDGDLGDDFEAKFPIKKADLDSMSITDSSFNDMGGIKKSTYSFEDYKNFKL